MRIPFMTITISFVASLLYLVFGEAPAQLIWLSTEEVSISFLSAHLAHISLSHLLWNVLALLVLGAIIEQTSRVVLAAAFFVGISAINLYLSTLYALDAYAGLSGVLNTLLVVALVQLSARPGYRLAAVLTLAASMIKIMFELHTSFSLMSPLPWPSVPQAHLVGWIAGLMFVFIQRWIARRELLSAKYQYSDDCVQSKQH